MTGSKERKGGRTMPKIKHESKFYVRLNRAGVSYFPENFAIYPGAVYGRTSDKNGKPVFWVCDNYAFVNGKLPVHIYSGGNWKLLFVGAKHPCYQWVKSAIEQLGYVPKISRETLFFDDVRNLMKANARHKKGSGSRIHTNQINGVLKWNEVTEDAHWHGHGNASVVAANIRR